MEKYSLILKNNTKKGPPALGIEELEAPRIPIKGEIISSDNLAGYIMNYANEKNNLEYISNFSYSNFVVDNVIHAPEGASKKKLEVRILVEATKIAKKK
jgi:hypothetical protein